jgi:ribosomal-protein-alanine N-acetyltransferase
MTHDDVRDVMAVDRLCFPTPWSENAYRCEMDNVSACYLVARLDGRLIGFAGSWMVMDEMHVTTIGIHPDCRRGGIADRLLAVLLEEGLSRGVRRVSLEVRESNQAAQALYQKHGFTPIARRRGYYSDTGEDAIVMWVEDLRSGVQVFRRSGPTKAEHEHEQESRARTDYRSPERLNA